MKRLGMWLWLILLLGVPVRAGAAQVAEAVIPVAVTAEGAPEGLRWTVELEAGTPGCPMPEGSIGNRYRMELKETGMLRIPCGDLGVYDYVIRQVPGEFAECTYDGQCYRLRLFVTAGNQVQALLYDMQEEKTDAVRFRNRWAQSVLVAFNAVKTLDGETPEDGRFAFRLLSGEGETVAEAENVGRNVTFPVLEFRQPGTYRYYLKEVKGTETKILYDRTVYTVTVEVFLDGDYRAAVRYQRNGKDYTGIPAFANYTDTGSPRTGDAIGRWAAVLAVSGTALAAVYTTRKRRQ